MSFVPPSASRLPENIEAIYPLTSMQKALLFHTAAAPLESAMYFQQLTWVIRSRLDGSLFREAWDRVVHRHAALRTFFLWQGPDEPAQCVCRRVQMAWTEEDWRNRDRWDAYVAAACDMFERTHTETAPWTLVEANNKEWARVKVIETVVQRVKAALESSRG